MSDTELIVAQPLKAEIVFAEGGVAKVLADIAAKVRDVKTDVSTVPGRAAIKSLAYKVVRSKTALDDLGKEHVADLKKRTGAIDAERRTIREYLDQLAEEVRAPLTVWENRIKGHEEQLALIMQTGNLAGVAETVAEIDHRVALVTGWPARDWEEFAERAAEAILQVTGSLTTRRMAVAKREAEAAELEQLRQEKAAREARERDEKIAAEAAERARIEAEAKAARDAEEAKARAEAEQRRVEKEKADAEEQARQAVANAEGERLARIAAEQRAIGDALALARRVEAERTAAAAQAEADRERAIQAERGRVAAEHAAAAAQAALREANIEHCRKVNAEAVAAIVHAGVSLEQAKLALTAIIRGQVPRVHIDY